ncbi:hypothetical protein BDK51DRAFT_50882 [Blyttiomyces helicus]|uniref:Extracellular metalloproteinase n=1 Tax=Blyttiomyces helicus TaxID=388810 RepID=A0A4V1IPL9_9FUNG|nr:hypothetical protein BDK51DRAFT_50882 [Blyttiomyces helicus]|eukprot:RKO83517.1 hypothetical protein BDK51DRAFT_50882 [Blyttiomyces helicus]
MVDSFKIQPCNPTVSHRRSCCQLGRIGGGSRSFAQARDASSTADKINNKGANYCDLWRGFAKRGLGVHAANKKDDFSVPRECAPGSSSHKAAGFAAVQEWAPRGAGAGPLAVRG